MANTRIDIAGLYLDNSLLVLDPVVWEQSQPMLPDHIFSSVLSVLWCHLPLFPLHIVVPLFESPVRIAYIVRWQFQESSITAKVYWHEVFGIEPVQPAAQFLTAAAAVRYTVPAKAVPIDGIFDAVKESCHVAIRPHGNHLLTTARIVMDIILGWWNILFHLLFENLSSPSWLAGITFSLVYALFFPART